MCAFQRPEEEAQTPSQPGPPGSGLESPPQLGKATLGVLGLSHWKDVDAISCRRLHMEVGKQLPLTMSESS